MQVSIVLPIVELDHPHVADDPEEHVGGVQQDGHGQLRRRGGRGGEREVHICPVLLGENCSSDQNSIFQGRLNVPGKKGRKLSKLESFPLINWELFVSCEIDWSKVKLFG